MNPHLGAVLKPLRIHLHSAPVAPVQPATSAPREQDFVSREEYAAAWLQWKTEQIIAMPLDPHGWAAPVTLPDVKR